MKKNNLKMFETLSDYIQKHQSGGIEYKELRNLMLRTLEML